MTSALIPQVTLSHWELNLDIPWIFAGVAFFIGSCGLVHFLDSLRAKDYGTKPIGIGELLARMRMAMRHTHRVGPEVTAAAFGHLRVDPVTRLVCLKIVDMGIAASARFPGRCNR